MPAAQGDRESPGFVDTDHCRIALLVTKERADDAYCDAGGAEQDECIDARPVVVNGSSHLAVCMFVRQSTGELRSRTSDRHCEDAIGGHGEPHTMNTGFSACSRNSRSAPIGSLRLT